MSTGLPGVLVATRRTVFAGKPCADRFEASRSVMVKQKMKSFMRRLSGRNHCRGKTGCAQLSGPGCPPRGDSKNEPPRRRDRREGQYLDHQGNWRVSDWLV